MALNKVMLIGNVGNDPEIRYLDSSNPQSPQGNAKVASFRLATTERFRDRSGETRENTEWHSIVAWRSNADLVEKFVHKGSQIYVEGKLRTRQWTDQTGAKRFTTEIQADNIQLLGNAPTPPSSRTATRVRPSPPNRSRNPATPARATPSLPRLISPPCSLSNPSPRKPRTTTCRSRKKKPAEKSGGLSLCPFAYFSTSSTGQWSEPKISLWMSVVRMRSRRASETMK